MDLFRRRGNIIVVFTGFIFMIFMGRLFSLQILSSKYQGRAERNVIKRKPIIPPRGNIYDRKNRIYVSNSPVFEIRITPRELEIPDTSVLTTYLEMSKEEIDFAIRKAKSYSPYKESILSQYIEPENYGPLQESMWNFSGVSFTTTNKRYYQYPVGANFLGYISEVDSSDILSEEAKYALGDLIGKTGIERSYDKILRGQKGERVVLKDVYNRIVGSYLEGKFDIKAEQGADLMLGIDTELQAFGESLFHNKKGSIVAIEPSTGEILAFVSAPYYDPNMLTGRESRKNWRKLTRDTLNPLFIRPLQAAYPPGSIFKLPVALAALNEGVITEESFYHCGGGFWRNGGKPGCRLHATPLSLKTAITVSCNSYFAATYVDFLNYQKFEGIYDGYEKWEKYMLEMGIGRKLDTDLPYEKEGLLPSAEFYDNEKRWYGKNRWNAMTIISNSIGQGEIQMTPIQMANMAAIIANKGKYITPHFVKAVKNQGPKNKKELWEKFSFPDNETSIERKHYETVGDAMELVVKYGTARRAFIPDITVCGKTGTVQNPHGENHAVFVGYAPKENPKIAIAVIMENAGGGGSWAAPAAGLMIEKYLKGEILTKQFEYNRIMNANFLR
ncbi:MAG: penicillin-binding protein 2 [Bacteroidota bacterium]